MWEKVIEKAIDIKAKASFQLPLKIKKINSKYPKDYRPAKKDKINWDHWDEDKNKSIQNPILTNNTNHLCAQVSKRIKTNVIKGIVEKVT